jgi:uncharacterized protein
MRNSVLALSCILLAGAATAQQTSAPSSTSSSPAAAKSPAASSSSASSKAPASEPESQAPANPLSDAQARQMLELTGGTKIKGQLTTGYMNYIHQSMPFLPKDVSDDLQQSFEKLDLETPMIAVYKQHISANDAEAIIAFYKTPAGKDMAEAMPMILQQQQQVAVQEGRKTAQEVIQKHRPEIEAAAKQYQAEHAPKPAPSLNSPGASGATPSAQPGAQPTAKPSGSTPSTGTAPSSNPQPTPPQQK